VVTSATHRSAPWRSPAIVDIRAHFPHLPHFFTQGFEHESEREPGVPAHTPNLTAVNDLQTQFSENQLAAKHLSPNDGPFQLVDKWKKERRLHWR
jgi:hypothetical protein